MSRIGKNPINLPSGVTIKVEGGKVLVFGPKGNLQINIPTGVSVDLANEHVTVKGEGEIGSLLGLTRTLVSNMVVGVTEGWSKVLELSGTGYRANTTGNELNLALGFSHPVKLVAPAGLTFEVKDNKITIRGADKSLVGEMAAKIRALKPADPYKAKGFKYEGEVIIRKAGKAAKAAGTGGK